MKKLFLVSITLLLSLTIHAQNCKYFEDMMQKSQALWKAGKFEQAMNQLAAAREDCPFKGALVDQRLVAFTNEIAKKYREAEVERRKAQLEATRADSVAEVNRKAALTEYANALAYKSKIALQEGDRNTAFRLAEFAELYVEEGNTRVLQQLSDALYYNILQLGTVLPRVENFEGSSSGISTLEYSSDGKYLATGSYDSLVTFWNLQSSEPFRKINCGRRWANSFALSPNGKNLAIAGRKELQIWDIESGVEHKLIKLDADFVHSIAYSLDGALLAYGTNDSATTVIEIQSQKEVIKVQTNSNREGSVAFSPDGKLLATSSQDSVVTIWEIATGKPYYTIPNKLVWFCDVAFSPDGKCLAIGTSNEGFTRLIDVERKETKLILQGQEGVIRCFAFSPDGKMLATGSMHSEVKIWDTEIGYPLYELSGHVGPIEAVAFSPDGRYVASSAWNTITKIWDLKDDKGNFSMLQDTPKVGLHTALKQDEYVDIMVLSYSPDSKRLVTIGLSDAATIWDIEKKSIVFRLTGHSDSVLSATYSPDGNWLATGSSDSTIKVWSATNGECLFTLHGHSSAVLGVTFSPDGKRLASVSRDQTSRIWDLGSRALVQTLRDSATWVNCIAFAPNGRLIATGSFDKQIRIWDIETGSILKRLNGHVGVINSVAFTSDGSKLASCADHMDASAKIWDLESGRNIATFRDDDFVQYAVGNVAISPDSHYFAASFGGKTVKIWNLNSGQLVLRVGGNSVVFAPYGKQIATGALFKVQIWELEAKKLIELWNRNGKTAGVLKDHLLKYNLEGLLSLHPDNVAKLIATKKLWQINEFAEVTAMQATMSNLLDRVQPYYIQADRLYTAALAIQDERSIRWSYARLLRNWAEVYRAESQEPKAMELEAKANRIYKLEE